MIKFDPGIFIPGLDAAASEPDEILFHELAHALRDTSGTALPKPDAKGNPYNVSVTHGKPNKYMFDNLEEFIAILVTNIYVSEKSPNAFLRKDHHGFAALSPLEAKPAVFCSDFKLELKNFTHGMHWFAKDLRDKVGNKAAFNPLTYYHFK